MMTLTMREIDDALGRKLAASTARTATGAPAGNAGVAKGLLLQSTQLEAEQYKRKEVI